MFLDRSKFTEPAYIGEELFRDEHDEKELQCMIVRKTVRDGVFTLEESLKAYEVSKDDYEDYLAKNFNNELMITLHANSDPLSQSMYLDVMNRMLNHVFGNKQHEDLAKVYKHLRQLSLDIKEEKVKF